MLYNQFLFKKIPFDPEKSLQPITNAFHLIHMLVVNSKLGVKNVDELVALLQAEAPARCRYLAPGPPLVLYMETLKKEKGADWVRVPFRGGGEAVTAILSGTTPIALFGEGNVIGNIRAGQMTPLVMMNNIRSPNFPNVPLLSRGRLQRPAVAELVRHLRAGRRAEADRRQAVQGDRRDHQRSGVPRAPSHRAEPGAGRQHARAVRRGDEGRAHDRREGGPRRGLRAAVASSAQASATRVPCCSAASRSDALQDRDRCDSWQPRLRSTASRSSSGTRGRARYATSTKISASRSGMSTITSCPHGTE